MDMEETEIEEVVDLIRTMVLVDTILPLIKVEVVEVAINKMGMLVEMELL